MQMAKIAATTEKTSPMVTMVRILRSVQSPLG